MKSSATEIKWHELIKGTVVVFLITVAYFSFLQVWMGDQFRRLVYETVSLVWPWPAASPAYVFLTLLTFLIILYLWKKDHLQKIDDRSFLLVSLGLVFFFDIFLASTNNGFIYAISHPFLSTPYEYYADLPKIKGLRSFIRDYVSMMPNLSHHANTHPPGGDVFLYIVERTFGKGVIRASLISILVTNLSLIPFYLTAKLFLDRLFSRLAVLLWILTPNIAIYSATCMDGVFMFFLLWPFYFFFKFLIQNKNMVLLAVVNGIALSIAMFMTFSATFHGLFFIILTGTLLYKKQQNWKRVLSFVIISGFTFCVIYVLGFYLLGYDIFDCLSRARDKDMMSYGSPLREWRIYLLSRTSNFAGFFLFSGFATSWLWFKYLFKKEGTKGNGNKMLRYCIYSFIITLLEMNLGGLYFFETGRVWIFLALFVILPVTELLNYFSQTSPQNHFDFQLLSLTFIQTFIFEIIFYTTW